MRFLAYAAKEKQIRIGFWFNVCVIVAMRVWLRAQNSEQRESQIQKCVSVGLFLSRACLKEIISSAKPFEPRRTLEEETERGLTI